MRFLKPKTLQTGTGEFTIYNKNGLLYYHPYGDRLVNIPFGDWKIKGSFRILDFQPYCSEPEFGKITENIYFDFNQNKASINLIEDNICVDKDYKDSGYLPLLPFLLLHEQAHNKVDNSRYDKENICDIYAINWMLANGYNPSQINILATVCLDNLERKKFIHNYINSKQYERTKI